MALSEDSLRHIAKIAVIEGDAVSLFGGSMCPNGYIRLEQDGIDIKPYQKVRGLICVYLKRHWLLQMVECRDESLYWCVWSYKIPQTAGEKVKFKWAGYLPVEEKRDDKRTVEQAK